MNYFLGFLCLILTSGALGSPLKIEFSATSNNSPKAGILVIDLIDGDGVFGSSALIQSSVEPFAIEGSVNKTNQGEYFVTDEQVISSLLFNLDNIYEGFNFNVDGSFINPGALGFPDALILSLFDVNFLPLFSTADPRGSDALLVLSSLSPEIYPPTGFSISVTSLSAVPLPSSLWLFVGGALLLMLARYRRAISLFALLSVVTFPAQATLMDVTPQASFTLAPLVYNRVTQTFNGLVSILNKGSSTLQSPMYLVVSGLPTSVSVYNATNLSTGGKPMLILPVPSSGLEPGKSIVNFGIKFHNPDKLKYTPTFKVLSNSGILPADPGEVGKSTLTGVDANRNEIRDDVENYIVVNFGTSQKLIQLLNQFAISMQKGLTARSEQESVQAANLTSRAMECKKFIAPDDESWKSVQAITVNTPERFIAWRAHEGRLSGNVFPGRAMREWKTSCSFDPDTLTN